MTYKRLREILAGIYIGCINNYLPQLGLSCAKKSITVLTPLHIVQTKQLCKAHVVLFLWFSSIADIDNFLICIIINRGVETDLPSSVLLLCIKQF